MRFIWSAASHQGMVRQNNEDALYPDSAGESAGPVTLMVADGMGGHVAGEVASRLAVNAAAATDLGPSDRVAAGNRAIREEVAAYPVITGPRTLFEVDTPRARLALTFQHRSRRWTVTALDEAA